MTSAPNQCSPKKSPAHPRGFFTPAPWLVSKACLLAA